jgi:hypothetical protein
MQKEYEFSASLGYIMRTYLKKKERKKKEKKLGIISQALLNS